MIEEYEGREAFRRFFVSSLSSPDFDSLSRMARRHRSWLVSPEPELLKYLIDSSWEDSSWRDERGKERHRVSEIIFLSRNLPGSLVADIWRRNTGHRSSSRSFLTAGEGGREKAKAWGNYRRKFLARGEFRSDGWNRNGRPGLSDVTKSIEVLL